MKTYLDHNLKSYNTFGISVLAGKFICLENDDDIRDFAGQQNRGEYPSLLLGGGSNLLFTSDYPGAVVKIDTRGIRVVKETADEVFLEVAAGEDWDELVGFCVERGWGGIENLSGIPGNAGSSPIQNIGAYGTELKDVFHSLEAIDLVSGENRTFRREECHFGYRDSIFKREFKGQVMITKVILALRKKPVPNLIYGALKQRFQDIPGEEVTIRQVREAVLQIRASKLPDPKVIGNAGSFFKNPIIGYSSIIRLKEAFPGIVYYEAPGKEVGPQQLPGTRSPESGYKLAAGWLIEQCGWKGYREGDAGVHKDQALVLVNYGHATGKQILDLSVKIQESVKEKFGVDLEREINIY